MRWLISACLLCVCLHAQTAGMEGIAVDAVTRQPMAGVHITLGGMADRLTGLADLDTYGAISRADGRFSITNLKPGQYFLSAKQNGYLLVPKKADSALSELTVNLKPGDQIHDFIVDMMPHAVITGHVLDADGDPVQRVEVMAESAVRGTSRLSMERSADTALTDDRGQFRLVVPPGKFYVRSRANGLERRPWMMGEIRSDGFIPPVYGQTYYPGVGAQDKAVAVELAPGQIAAGIDFPLLQQISVSISGIVTGMPAGGQTGVFIRVFGPASQQSAFAGPDGIFTVSGLNPGKYKLLANSQSPDDSQRRSAWVEVNAETGPARGVTLALVPGETISGKLEFAADSAKTAPPEKLSVRLEAAAPDGLPIAGADIGDNGTFQISQVFPDKYRVRVSPLPENAYVKSVRLGNTEVTAGVLDLSSGVTGAALTLTLSRGGGHVEGRVVGEDGLPLSNALALVILASGDDQPNDKDIRPVEPGAKFAYSGLAPGRYRLLALDPEQLMGGRDNPGILKTLLVTAPEFEIHENDRLSKDLKITTNEDPGAKR